MKRFKKCISLLLVAVMMVSMFVIPGGNVQAAKKKVQLSKKTVTLEVGKKVTLKLKNAPKKKKITWSSSKKKIASVTKKGVVTARKAGKANITAKVSGKKYVCKVTVKKKKNATTQQGTTEKTKAETTTESSTTEPSTTETPDTPPSEPEIKAEKNADDVANLNKIIKDQLATGAKVSSDLDSDQYRWDDKTGRLTRIYWWYCGITNCPDFKVFSSLTSLTLVGNPIDSLDVTNNTALTELNVQSMKLKSLGILHWKH